MSIIGSYSVFSKHKVAPLWVTSFLRFLQKVKMFYMDTDLYILAHQNSNQQRQINIALGAMLIVRCNRGDMLS